MSDKGQLAPAMKFKAPIEEVTEASLLDAVRGNARPGSAKDRSRKLTGTVSQFPGSMNDNGVQLVGDYELIKKIGKGVSGVVFRAKHKDSGQLAAIKRISLSELPEEDVKDLLNEIKLLRDFIHPNIVMYYDAVHKDKYLNIIMEYVEHGSLDRMLADLRNKGHVIKESLVASYTLQLLKGLAYLHGKRVIHRDIKGANILISKGGKVKVADFGVATRMEKSTPLYHVVGTPYWMAPEIIEMTGQLSTACDIWSVGCTVVEMLTGNPPYFHLDHLPAMFRVVQDKNPPIPEDVSPELESFLRLCFDKNPTSRSTAEQLIEHPWLEQARKLNEADEKLYKEDVLEWLDADHDGEFSEEDEEHEEKEKEKKLSSKKDHQRSNSTLDVPPGHSKNSSSGSDRELKRKEDPKEVKKKERHRKTVIKLMVAMGYEKEYVLQALKHVDASQPHAMELAFRWMETHPFSSGDRSGEDPEDSYLDTSPRSERGGKHANRDSHRGVQFRETAESERRTQRRKAWERDKQSNDDALLVMLKKEAAASNSEASSSKSRSKSQGPGKRGRAATDRTSQRNAPPGLKRPQSRTSANSRLRLPGWASNNASSSSLSEAVSNPSSNESAKGAVKNAADAKKRGSRIGLSVPRTTTRSVSPRTNPPAAKAPVKRRTESKDKESASAAAKSKNFFEQAKKREKQVVRGLGQSPSLEDLAAEAAQQMASLEISSRDKNGIEIEVHVRTKTKEKALGFLEVSSLDHPLAYLRDQICTELDHVPKQFVFFRPSVRGPTHDVAIPSHQEDRYAISQVRGQDNIIRICPVKAKVKSSSAADSKAGD